jgi:hypothetical protein
MTDYNFGALDGWDDELNDWTDTTRRYRCETGACVRVETDGASTVIWETAQPDIRVVTSTESWQALLDEVRAEERARIVAELRDDSEACRKRGWLQRSDWTRTIAAELLLGVIGDLSLKRGEIDDVAASND